MSKEPKDLLQMQRGDYETYLPGPILLTSFRLLSIPVQYHILQRIPTTSLPILLTLPAPPLSTLGLNHSQTPLTLAFNSTSHLLLTAMPTYIALKQSAWAFFILREKMTIPFALFGGLSGLGFETATSYIATLQPYNPFWHPSMVPIGFALNALGLTVELVSEIYRLRWKKDPKNEGQVYTGGIWGLARNANYTCNLVFAFGWSLAAGGPVYAALYTGIYVCNFMFNAIPGLEGYMESKYGEKWEKAKKEVRWRLIPGIY